MPRPSPKRRVVTQQQRDEAMNLPLVREIVDRFGARLVDLHERPQHPGPGPDDSETTEETETTDTEENDDV